MDHRRWRLKSGILFTILALLAAAPAASPDKIQIPLDMGGLFKDLLGPLIQAFP